MLFIEVLAVILVEDFCDVTSYRNNPLRKAAVLKIWDILKPTCFSLNFSDLDMLAGYY